jgi:hypothetical protein
MACPSSGRLCGLTRSPAVLRCARNPGPLAHMSAPAANHRHWPGVGADPPLPRRSGGPPPTSPQPLSRAPERRFMAHRCSADECGQASPALTCSWPAQTNVAALLPAHFGTREREGGRWEEGQRLSDLHLKPLPCRTTLQDSCVSSKSAFRSGRRRLRGRYLPITAMLGSTRLADAPP